MSKIRESARGEECLVRLAGICNFDNSTTIFAHIGGGGMGTKQPDSEGAYCCSACHDEIDGRTAIYGWTNPKILRLYHHEGAMRTRKILIDKGLLILK